MIIQNFLYILSAIFGLGILVFIHEFGHYFMAKRAKMKIEVFSIGFGKPIYKWMKNGVQWQIGFLPFGGYVKIAGMQHDEGKDPRDIPDGFFEKKPIDRIKVALAGPFVNLFFALAIFAIIWSFGGRNKPFSEYTNKIGYIDERSKLYENNVRHGDEILKYNDIKFSSYKENILYSSVLKNDFVRIIGNKIDYYSNIKTPFDYTLKPYFLDEQKDFSSIGILSPAQLLICNEKDQKAFFPSVEKKLFKNKDRLAWINGELIFSLMQFKEILNNDLAFVTFLRDSKIMHAKMNLYKFSDLNIESFFKNSVSDWKYESNLKKSIEESFILPYSFDTDANVLSSLEKTDGQKFVYDLENEYNAFLKKGDKIIAINGKKINGGKDLFYQMQDLKPLIIVQKATYPKSISYKNEDQIFNENIKINELKIILDSVGSSNMITENGTYRMLNDVEFTTTKMLAEKDVKLQQKLFAQKKQLENIKDLSLRKQALASFENSLNAKILGVNFSDLLVKYNPNPFTLFINAFKEVFRTLKSLFSGALSPKYLAGPIGIFQIIKYSWNFGLLEVLYWLAFISINLGILNLLPIPVLDGGHVIFSFIEMITKKRLKVRYLEKATSIFAILLIGFMIFATYNDILRVIKSVL